MSAPSVGNVCIAKYDTDGQWYRGEIVSAAGDGNFSVLFVDYGNEETVGGQSIYPVSPSLLETPTQAFKCSLVGVLPAPGKRERERERSLDDLDTSGLVLCNYSLSVNARRPVVRRVA